MRCHMSYLPAGRCQHGCCLRALLDMARVLSAEAAVILAAVKRTANGSSPGVRLMLAAAGTGRGHTAYSHVAAHPQSSIRLPDKPPLSMSSMCQAPASKSHRGSGEGRAVGSWLTGPGDASSAQRRSKSAGGSTALPAPLRTTCSCDCACANAPHALMQYCNMSQNVTSCLVSSASL